MIRILRPTGATPLISARVFEGSFASGLAPELEVERVGLAPWLDAVFGRDLRPGDRAVHKAFRAATRGYGFLCPDYQAIPLAPLLLYVRNRSRSPVRLLLVAHAPGAYALEWALLRPLLRRGDRIVAPTLSALGVIDLLCPELTPRVRIVPHPLRPLPRVGPRPRQWIVSLTRMHSTKLLHRQIEAMALLRERGLRHLGMRIAAPLHEPGTREPSPYARALAAKIARLGLEGCVELAGEVGDPRRKAGLLAGARLLVNLSVTIEESFGKAIAEAAGCGVPVLATRWDGLPETLGAGGACVPVDATALGMDVPGERIADAMERLLETPPGPDVCRREALRFHPRRVRRLYRRELEAALAEGDAAEEPGEPPSGLSAAPERGLLGDTAPLGRFSWSELFELHLQDAARLREGLAGAAHKPAAADELRSLLIHGLRAPLGRFLAGAPMEGMDSPVGESREPAAAGDGFFDRVASAALGRATQSSRLACLGLMAGTGRPGELRRGLEALRADGLRSWGVRFLEIEALRQEGEYQRAFQGSIEPEEPVFWGELAAPRLRQLAAVCRDWRLPALALPWLRDWLERFPDSPGSALVWLDRSVNAAAAASPELLAEARQAFEEARRQLGDDAGLADLGSWIERSETGDGCGQAVAG